MKNEKCEALGKLECVLPDNIVEEVNCLCAYVNKNQYNYNVVKAMVKSIDELCDIKINTDKVLIDALNKCVKKGKL